MDLIAFGFTVTSDREGRVTAQSQQGSSHNQKSGSWPAQLVLTWAVINEVKLLGIEVQQAKDHAITNAVGRRYAHRKNKKKE